MAQWGKLNYAQKSCLGSVGKLMRDAGMIHPGARIGVAVSGGVDSFLLLQLLVMRRRIVPFDFELMALHVNPGFDPANHAPLADWLADNGLPGHIALTDHGPMAHSEANRTSSPCFLCAWHRRKALFSLCRRYGLTHLALAHTTDDLAATFFMNLFKGGKVQGLSACEDFFDGRLKVIRPLLFMEKKVVVKAARSFGLPVWENPCPSSKTSQRIRTEQWMAEMFRADKDAKYCVFNALRRWQLDFNAKRH